ncbi:hypothetical protein P4O66_015573 [Electrophorus voltai]|uniref:Synaptotagmin-7 n=1 Tax=Electrophorus voltai TaxID=2609070 RepID=A0AAD8YZK6_9TELE|nr:hypothetical protein P4O66_015573 [Electrophorus voltai]
MLETGSVALSVFLVSLAVTVCAVWLVALCGVCGWCQRKVGKRGKPGLESVGTPDSARGRGEKKAINDLDRDFWNNNDSNSEQQRWSSYPPKEFVLNISPYAPYGDPRLTLNFHLFQSVLLFFLYVLLSFCQTPLPPAPSGAVPGGQKGSVGGDGGGPSRRDSVKSTMMSGSKTGRWQTVQSHMRSGDLKNGKGEMVISQHTKKASPGRTSVGRLAPHTPRHMRSGQTRHTPRSAQPRAAAGRKQPAHTSAAHAHAHTHAHAHSHRSLSAQGGPARPGNGHTHAYAHLWAHADQGGCNLLCYLCYSGYCLGLTLLSFCLLLLLSPSSPRSPSPPHSSPLLPSNSPHPDDFSYVSWSSLSSLAFPFCPHPSAYPSSFNLSAFSPLLSSTDSLLHPHAGHFPFNLSSSVHSCPSSLPSCPAHRSSLSPDRPLHDSTSSSPPSRPFLLIPPSLLFLSRPSLCHSRPPSSSRSLPSLLLCPHSFTDPALSSLEHTPTPGATPRPRTLLRHQSLQQPLIHPLSSGLESQSSNSQSLGQLNPQTTTAGGGGGGEVPEGGGGAATRSYRSGTGTRASRSSTAGGGASRYRSGGTGNRALRGTPGSWEYVMSQIKNRGLDVKSFLEGKMVVLSLAIGLAEQDDFANLPDLQEVPPSQETLPDMSRTVGNKPGNSPKGHPPDADGHSSVSDLANSLTGDMVMLSPGSDEDHEGPISEKLGKIQFSVGYSFQDSTLTVKIMKGQDLPAKDFSGTSDPFVKIYLLPDKKHKLETKVKRKNLNPHWNETFLFEGFPYEKVRERTLYMQVLDYDRFSRNDPIGEVSIPLNKVELGQNQPTWKDLKPCSDGSGSRGDLLVSLCYNPTANIITVNIIKGRNLKAMDIGGTSDPYVKVWLMHKDKRVEKKKTVTIKRCLNPVFNESFPFDVPAHVLRETTIIITVMDKDRLSRNDVIGKIYLSWKSGPAEVKHWKDMLSRPRTNVAQWHALKA